MRRPSARAILLASFLVAGMFPAGAAIHDSAGAIEAARRHTKARCTASAPCKYKAQRDGKQWRVWVEHAGGTLVLYFDAEGNLLRRLEAD